MRFCFCQEIVADKIAARYLGRTAIVIASVNDAIQKSQALYLLDRHVAIARPNAAL